MKETSMTPKEELADESSFIINEIENNLEKVLQKRKEEVDVEFQEKIRLEKEETERKKSEIENEFERERGMVKEFRGAISEFETARQSLQGRMRDHLERGMRYQQDIEKLTSLTLEELRKVNDLSTSLSQLRQNSEKKISEIKAKLKDRFGIATEAPEPAEESEPSYDLEQELGKLKKIKELLEEDSGHDGAAYETSVPPVPAAEPPAVPEEPGFQTSEKFESLRFDSEHPPAEFKMPEINQFIEDFMKREPFRGSAVQEHVPPVREEKKSPYQDLDFQAVFTALEKLRKSEAIDAASEISYFQNRDRMILDGESLLRAITQVQDNAEKLTQKLAVTESPKDQFFIKQELINHQEALRKIVLRCVRMCEKEAGSLPRYTSEILNKAVLKEMLDKLNLDNWSNPEDFRSFGSYAGEIKDAFNKRITPPAYYLRSILEELEA
jgi:hypothetical protein